MDQIIFQNRDHTQSPGTSANGGVCVDAEDMSMSEQNM